MAPGVGQDQQVVSKAMEEHGGVEGIAKIRVSALELDEQIEDLEELENKILPPTMYATEDAKNKMTLVTMNHDAIIKVEEFVDDDEVQDMNGEVGESDKISEEESDTEVYSGVPKTPSTVRSEDVEEEAEDLAEEDTEEEAEEEAE